MAAVVQIDLMEARAFVVGNVNQKILALDELPQRTVAQRSGWQTTRLRAVLGVGCEALLLDGNGRGEPLGLTRIDGTRNPPDAGKIGLAIEGARRWTGGRMVPFHVGGYPQAIFAQRVELRTVRQMDVELQSQPRFDNDTPHGELSETRRRGHDKILTRRQIRERVFSRGGGGGLENGVGLGVLGLHFVVADGIADGIEKNAGDSALGRGGLCECGDCQAESEREVIQTLFCTKLKVRGADESAAAGRPRPTRFQG